VYIYIYIYIYNIMHTHTSAHPYTFRTQLLFALVISSNAWISWKLEEISLKNESN